VLAEPIGKAAHNAKQQREAKKNDEKRKGAATVVGNVFTIDFCFFYW
jgi:hypothetical protein